MLAHEDGTKHVSCFLDETKDRQKALTKKIDPQSNMIVEWVESVDHPMSMIHYYTYCSTLPDYSY